MSIVCSLMVTATGARHVSRLIGIDNLRHLLFAFPTSVNDDMELFFILARAHHAAPDHMG